MRIVESNRLDVLADDLIANWPHPKQSTLSPIRIVVPSLGVARWLTFRVASAFGICALVEFVYRANYVWTLFATVLDGLSSRSPFDAETLTWRVYRVLSRDAAEPSFAPVTAYLHSGDARDRLIHREAGAELRGGRHKRPPRPLERETRSPAPAAGTPPLSRNATAGALVG